MWNSIISQHDLILPSVRTVCMTGVRFPTEAEILLWNMWSSSHCALSMGFDAMQLGRQVFTIKLYHVTFCRHCLMIGFVVHPASCLMNTGFSSQEDGGENGCSLILTHPHSSEIKKMRRILLLLLHKTFRHDIWAQVQLTFYLVFKVIITHLHNSFLFFELYPYATC